MRSALSTLGYTPEHAQVIIGFVAPVIETEEAKTSQYMLGYNAPLETADMVTQLKDLSAAIKEGHFSEAVQDKGEWTNKVKTHQSEATKHTMAAAASKSLTKAERITAAPAETLSPNQQGHIRRLGARMIRGVLGRVTRR